MGRTKGASNRTPRELKKDGLFKLSLSKKNATIKKLRSENSALRKSRKAK